MKSVLALLPLCVLATPTLTLAEDAVTDGGVGNHMRPENRGPGSPVKMTLLAKQMLKLTDGQIRRLRALESGSITPLAERRNALREAHQTLRDTAENPESTSDAIREAAKELGKCVGEMAVYHKEMKQKIDEILTDEQEETASALRERDRKTGRPSAKRPGSRDEGEAGPSQGPDADF